MSARFAPGAGSGGRSQYVDTIEPGCSEISRIFGAEAGLRLILLRPAYGLETNSVISATTPHTTFFPLSPPCPPPYFSSVPLNGSDSSSEEI